MSVSSFIEASTSSGSSSSFLFKDCGGKYSVIFMSVGVCRT